MVAPTLLAGYVSLGDRLARTFADWRGDAGGQVADGAGLRGVGYGGGCFAASADSATRELEADTATIAWRRERADATVARD